MTGGTPLMETSTVRHWSHEVKSGLWVKEAPYQAMVQAEWPKAYSFWNTYPNVGKTIHKPPIWEWFI